MNDTLRLSFRRGDLIAIGLVALLALAVMLAFALPGGAEQELQLQIFQDGKLIRSLPLSSRESIPLTGEYSCTVCVDNGRASISQSDCPGGDCMRSGWISAPGRSIVCLPNRVELRITGASEVDFVVR